MIANIKYTDKIKPPHKAMTQKGYKLENQQVVPNMVEEKTTKKTTKTVTQLRKDIKFDDKSGKFFLRETRVIETPGRSLGAMISILTKAIQELEAKGKVK